MPGWRAERDTFIFTASMVVQAQPNGSTLIIRSTEILWTLNNVIKDLISRCKIDKITVFRNYNFCL